MNWRDWERYGRYRLGLRATMPAAYINRIKVCESGAPLVDISGDSTFSFGPDVPLRGGFWVRAPVADMLRRAALLLPVGYRLHLVHGYRSQGHQWALWIREVAHVRRTHPAASEAEIIRLARAMIACPDGGYGPHQTGGAIDVTLVDDKGDPLDMGTPILFLGDKSAMRCRDLSRGAMQNRRLLSTVLRQVGFNNYPGEWWHWSYGDRMWAAYTHQRRAIFGAVSCDGYQLTADELKLLADFGVENLTGLRR